MPSPCTDIDISLCGIQLVQWIHPHLLGLDIFSCLFKLNLDLMMTAVECCDCWSGHNNTQVCSLM